jgi:prepilin peptidase CpaA
MLPFAPETLVAVMLNQALLFFFPLMMAFAASSDLITMRISNRVTLGLVAAFVLVAILMGMPLGVFGIHIAIAFVVLVVGFAFFSFGWIGGGDAKLAAATVLWLGLVPTVPYLIYAALLGGVLTIVLLVLRRLPLPQALVRVSWVDRLHDHRTGVPYGIALAMAGLLVYSDTSVFAFFSA